MPSRRRTSHQYTRKNTTAAGTPVRIPDTTAAPTSLPCAHTTTTTSGPDVSGNAANRPPIRSPNLTAASETASTNDGVSNSFSNNSTSFDTRRPWPEFGAESTGVDR
jgi:hypothetical protein